MAEILLDSNVVIAFMEDQNMHHSTALAFLVDGDHEFHISALTMSECLVEAFRRGYEYAISCIYQIRNLVVKVLDLDELISISAARIGAERDVHLADSIILATAEFQGIPLWTFDKRLANKSPNIRYLLQK